MMKALKKEICSVGKPIYWTIEDKFLIKLKDNCFKKKDTKLVIFKKLDFLIWVSNLNSMFVL